MNSGENLEPTRRPEFFYKYRSMRGDCEKERLLEIINSSRIYYAPPSSFNDPFDCRVPPVESFEPSFIRYLIAAQNGNGDGAGVEVHDKFIAQRFRTETETQELNGDLSQEEQQDFKGILKKIQYNIDNSGVIAFSEMYDCSLMWSHYADNHKGVCLKFSLQKWHVMQAQLYPLIYSVGRIPLKLDQKSFYDGQLFKAAILTKDEAWGYEQEWRAISRVFGNVDFPSEALIGIIFGCATSETDKEWLKISAREGTFFQQAKLKEREFGLDII